MDSMDEVILAAATPPRGIVKVDGAKNSALPLIAASLLAQEGVTRIARVPHVTDVVVLLRIVESLGASVHADWDTGTIEIDASTVGSHEPPPPLVRSLRGSLMLLAPLLARRGSARLARPGGCSIGQRKYDIHLRCLQEMGARIREQGPEIVADADALVGRRLLLEMPTHTGTQQLILAAVCAKGTTTILNASREPEVATLCEALQVMGAQVAGLGSSILTIEGVPALRGADIACSTSRLETGLFAMLGCIPGARIQILGAADTAEPVLCTLEGMGASLSRQGDALVVDAPNGLRAANISTWPYPGFPTDSQSHLMALCCFAAGSSYIHETLYENRFQAAPELERMGASIQLHDRLAVVSGPRTLVGTEVYAPDLQGGAALLLAASGASGTTTLRGFEHVRRGYPHIANKLRAVGVSVEEGRVLRS